MSGMTQSKWRWSWQFSVRLLVIGGAIPFAAIAPCFANGIASLHALSGNYVLAQITPDGTLGAESSVTTPNVNIKGHSADRIDGGAIRGTNLFHSFSQFNVDNGQRVYFANPVGIENILTRVTGGNPSNILGTLGVDGGANLFLLNPNGIIFGSNARLDIAGSFFATTANSVVFNDGVEFSATKPQAPPLLNIKVPLGLQYGTSQPAAIVNAGQLAVGQGQTLSLSAGIVVSTGQLSAPMGQVSIIAVPSIGAFEGEPSSLSTLLIGAGGGQNLGLTVTETDGVKLTESGLSVEPGDIAIAKRDASFTQGQEIASVQARTVTLSSAHNLTLVESQLNADGNLNLLARDTVRVRDSVANRFSTQVGGNLYVQGDRGIDILALNHPGKAFESGGNLSLVSDGIISGDAHFASGGSFSILNLLGNPGNFVSLYDPIISSVGDVALGDYTGVALKVESMGSITVGNITITGRDTTLTPGSDPDIDILRNSPALILRAGVPELKNPPTPPNPPTPLNPPTPSNPSIVISSTPVYDNNFEGTVGSEWSSTSTDITPRGSRRLLGQFGSETVNLALDSLPSHTQATVSFDLFIIRSWDGNRSDAYGPDIFNLSVAGGQTLLQTTFGNPNADFYSGQAYPDAYPGGQNPGLAGAKESNTLGYRFGRSINNFFQGYPLDSVYRLDFSFLHTDNSLQLNFSASLTEGIGDESWGLDNVKVSVETTLPSSGVPSTPSIPNKPTFISPGGLSAGSITAGNILTLGGPVILSATSDIALNGSITSRGGNIYLNSGGTIDTTAGTLNSRSAQNGGAITMNANGDIKAGDIASSGDRLGGNITLNSGGEISVDSTKIIRSDIYGSGQGGDIEMAARSVLFTHGARVLTGTFNDGVGGNLSVTADVVELVGTSADNRVPSLLSTSTGGNQPAGDLTINTRQLIVRDGAMIGASTSGAGQGGNLTVNASESVELMGTSATGFPSGLSTDTVGEGNAGNLTINTRRFVARNGAAVSASTFGEGKGGSLTVNASESVELSSTTNNGFASGLYAQAFGDGNAGNLTINTQDLIVQDAAKVTVAAGTAADARVPNPPSLNLDTPIVTFDPDAIGTAGNIEVTARSIFMDNQGKIIAQTESSEGGNITLQVQDLLLMRHNSQISATAGTAQAGGNGGNIRINAPLIVAVPKENSDITANAFLGNGGNVQISTQGIYGLQFRPRLTPRSDITASSEFGVDGIVEINGPIVDPARGLANLPTETVSPEVSQVCQPGASQASSEFVITGRGGKPPSPSEPLNSNAGWVDSRSVTPRAENRSGSTTATQSLHPTSPPLVEAQGWVYNDKGEVELVAEAPTVIPYSSWPIPATCNQGRSVGKK